MLAIKINDTWKNFANARELVGFLARHGCTTELEERVDVALRFRATAQVKAISHYPLAAISGLEEDSKNLLYSSNPQPDTWYNLPPLVVLQHEEGKYPIGSVVDGIATIWRIDVTSDESLVESLEELNIIEILRPH